MQVKSIKVIRMSRVVEDLDAEVIQQFENWCKNDLGWSFGYADFSLFSTVIVADRAKVFSLLSERDDVMDQLIKRIENMDRTFIDFNG
jgi:hypothetical protein